MTVPQPLTPEEHKAECLRLIDVWTHLVGQSIVSPPNRKLTAKMETLILETLRQLHRMKETDESKG